MVRFKRWTGASWLPSATDNYYRSSPGVRERFIPLNSQKLAYLILPDGGKVEFQATQSSECDYELRPPCEYFYSYKTIAIYDPYEVKTVWTYNDNGSLNTVTEAGGRWIQVLYKETEWTNSLGAPDVVIDYIQASDGRTVRYNYNQTAFAPGTTNYTNLVSVTYFPVAGNPVPIIAYYGYQAPNVGNPNLYPLLAIAYDPMYAGPMKRIQYRYATANNDPGINVVVGQIESERSGATGEPVSQLYVPFISRRGEVRGDGPGRVFQYDGALMRRVSDFYGRDASQDYDGNSYVNMVIDRNENVTNITNEWRTGRPTEIKYPLTPSDSTRASVKYAYGGDAECEDPFNQDANKPYYLCKATNERGYSTRYWRDAKHRVTRIDYPDGGFETFTYHERLGVVLTHRLVSSSSDPSAYGGLETFVFDENGRLLEYRDPYHPATVDSAHPEIAVTGLPSQRFTYDSAHRVESVTDVRNYTTNFEYTPRGEVKKVWLPPDPMDSQRHTIEKTYNDDGTVRSSKDELDHTTSYTYDDYKRPLTAVLPEPSPNVARVYYDRTGGISTADYSHADTNPRRLVFADWKGRRYRSL